MSGLIRFDNISFGYEAGKQAIKNVSLSVERGEFIAIIGGNGSGKTTLAKHCNGLYKPTSGTVTVKGRDTRELSVAELSRIVTYCYQNPDHQIFQSTVFEEVAFGPKNMGLPQAEVEKRVTEALRAVGLEHMRTAEPYFSSKGTRQKIAVASILAMKPEAIVLDEPTTGLDYRGVREIMQLLQKLHRDGHTIIVVTHDMKLVAEYALRVLVMHQGTLLRDGTPGEVFACSDVLQKAQVEAPSVYRFGVAAGWNEPVPLTLEQAKARVAEERIPYETRTP
ncbi:energy-coupling factor ABC transporter ATP-binding protein [Brevibacillus borstelensis]|uniref:energy-coupling factor ABC transporter ATP-binding protein n=1 Tax=Brevibacillus borstelensis TaxID=45462 RepID=UPI0030BC9FF6